MRRWHRALDGLRETATAAAARGITLALQNHAPVLRPGYDDALAMLRELDRPNVGLLSLPETPSAQIECLRPRGPLRQLAAPGNAEEWGGLPEMPAGSV